MGKTAFMLNLAVNITKIFHQKQELESKPKKQNAVIFSLEMTSRIRNSFNFISITSTLNKTATQNLK